MADNTVPSGTFGDYSPTNSEAEQIPSNYEICQRSGFKVRPGDLAQQWDGLRVRRDLLDTRHPQDFVRSRPETPRPSRSPEAPDSFVEFSDILTTEAGDYLSLETPPGFLLTESAAQVSTEDL